MYRSALRATPRISPSVRHSALRSAAPRRFASTVPADKSRSWKSSAARWGLAIGALYYYNTSTAFAEEPISSTVPAPAHFSDDDMTTVDAIVAQKRKEAEARQLKAAASEATAKSPAASATNTKTTQNQDGSSSSSSSPSEGDAQASPAPQPGSPEALEAEAGQQGAFNPETGEINWDCPCLGGMADGPCGEDFKAAFSCFVYSTEEPKGIDCIDKFQAMQDCFRQHPEIYGEELADDEEAGEAAPPVEGEAAAPAAPKTAATTESTDAVPAEIPKPEKETAKVETTAPKQAQPTSVTAEAPAPKTKLPTSNSGPKPDPMRDATQAPVKN
ncbi:uncharacterized protein B0I36DRAFT_421519 [Microdochium trichocladiopsis]|uniref:Mitochondrial intermembrane space import and assembly protein 40 n=1 Tax=Microdochium trichocladiopsis TaxID=1682393 RepID=A0A9P9BTF9_9PEZI|nr:uncharacterized protein B0I36DRAFT_421519 [Microdochium trichocladiopsis]KAH7035925.1 hypothetical protein B0I36DRAFT_421519 [Microdochium trichocladiopsis]